MDGEQSGEAHPRADGGEKAGGVHLIVSQETLKKIVIESTHCKPLCCKLCCRFCLTNASFCAHNSEYMGET